MEFTPFRVLRVVLAGTGMCIAGALQAQTSGEAPATPCAPPAQGSAATNPDCTPSGAAAPAAKRFPYPGEQTDAPSGATQRSQPSPPQDPSAQASQQPAGKRFPYPGEAGSAPEPAASSPLQDAGSSGASTSSSNSSSGSSDSSSSAANHPDDPDANDPAAIPRRDRHKLPPVPRQSPSEREQEDVQVAGFYFNDGNYKGSYDRALDAVSLDKEDAAAQLALGNAARKLGKLDEAERAFRLCLTLDPVPRVRKPAERALREMTGEN